MQRLDASHLHTPGFRNDLRWVLLAGEAHAVVLPYVDMFHSALIWPPSQASIRMLREQRLPVARESAIPPCFRVQEFPLFASVSLSEVGRNEQQRLFASTGASEPNILAACGLSP